MRPETNLYFAFDLISTGEGIVGQAEVSVYRGGKGTEGVIGLLTWVLTRCTTEALITVPVDGQSEHYLRIGVATIQDPAWAASLSRGRAVLG